MDNKRDCHNICDILYVSVHHHIMVTDSLTENIIDMETAISDIRKVYQHSRTEQQNFSKVLGTVMNPEHMQAQSLQSLKLRLLELQPTHWVKSTICKQWAQ